MSAGRPYRCTGMIAFVRSVTAASTDAGSRAPAVGLDAVEDGRRAHVETAFAVATQVFAGTSASSPGPRPRQSSPRISAAVQDETQRTCGAPR